jgi:hypothetical protein
MARIDIPSNTLAPDLWREVIALTEAKGFTHDGALAIVAAQWLLAGDTAPFLAAVTELDTSACPGAGLLLGTIARMLLGAAPDYALTLVQRPGRPPTAGQHWRNFLMVGLYHDQRRAGITIAAALTTVANHFGVSEETVRTAVKAARKKGWRGRSSS